jgi:hypothetical protein
MRWAKSIRIYLIQIKSISTFLLVYIESIVVSNNLTISDSGIAGTTVII